METIIVTGGAGFIGSHLCDLLLKNKYFVVNIDNLDPLYSPEYKLTNIKKARTNRDYHFYNVDIRNASDIEQIFKTHENSCLVHLAGLAGVRSSLKNPQLYWDVNVLGTDNLLKTAAKLRINKFIYASSSSVYGNTKFPFSEKQKNLKPLSPYGKTKLQAEHICLQYSQKFKTPVVILRFFSVYGPRGRPDMAPYVFTQAAFENKRIIQYGNGLMARDWTYITDIITGIIYSLKTNFKREIINLGNNTPIPLINLINMIEKITSKKIRKIIQPRNKVEPEITFADINKAKEMLQWQPKISFETGIRNFVDWYKNERLIRS